VGFGHIALMEWFGPRRLQCCSSSSLFVSVFTYAASRIFGLGMILSPLVGFNLRPKEFGREF
jgi:hypothetical protein